MLKAEKREFLKSGGAKPAVVNLVSTKQVVHGGRVSSSVGNRRTRRAVHKAQSLWAGRLASGVPLPLPAPYEITGPASVTLPPEVVQMPDGSKITTQPEKQLGYGPNTVTVTDKTTRTETSPTGVTTPISTSTSAQPLPSQPSGAAAPEIQTCGYPGGPACKIDETGTPEALPKGQYVPALDDYKAKADENRTTIGGNGDKPFFTGWNLFFFAPALAPCEPVTLPEFQGRPMGQLDACNVVEGTRSVMSYIWALGALFLCLGMIKKVV